MYCIKCGQKLIDSSRFCPNCGAFQSIDDSSVQVVREEVVQNRKMNSRMVHSDINMEALLVYVGDLRLLEAMLYSMKSKQQQLAEQRDLLGIRKTFNDPIYPKQETFSVPMGRVVGIVFCLIVAWIAFPIGDSFNIWSGIIALGVAIALVGTIFYDKSLVNGANEGKKDAYQRAWEFVKEQRANDEKRVQDELAKAGRIQDEIGQYIKIESEILEQLKKAYSINIIPKQYRNFHSIYYIYEYLASPDNRYMSLEDTFERIDRDNFENKLFQKLDRIIENQTIQIYNQELTNRLLSTSLGQFTQLEKECQKSLNLLAKIEENSSNALEYAKISENHLAVNNLLLLSK